MRDWIDYVTYSNCVGVLSILAAAGAIYLAITDQKAAAGTMGGLFLIMAIVGQLDSFKSFKAFSVEAQLQDKIEKADELIKQLRELSLLVAKAGYGSTGMSMLAIGSQDPDVVLVKDFDKLLAKLKLSKVEIDEVRRPLYRVIAIKLAAIMANTSNSIINLKPATEGPGSGLIQSQLFNSSENYQRRMVSIDNPEKLRSFFMDILPNGMTKDQQVAAERYVDKLVTIYEGCVDSGGPTPDFLELERKSSSLESSSLAAKDIFDGKSPN